MFGGEISPTLRHSAWRIGLCFLLTGTDGMASERGPSLAARREEPGLLSKAELTARFAERLRAAIPSAQAVIRGDLEIGVTGAGCCGATYLQNACEAHLRACTSLNRSWLDFSPVQEIPFSLDPVIWRNR